MPTVFLYPIIPAIILGILNWIYWKKQGYTSKVQLVLGVVLFYVIFYSILKQFY